MNLYKLYIRTREDVRLEVVVEAMSVYEIIQMTRIDDLYINFLSKDNPDYDSFTIFKSDIKRIDYQVLKSNPFSRGNIYEIK